MFIHLHCHSNHSFTDSTITVGDLIRKAAEFNMNAVALTDTNGFYGVIPFYKKAVESGIKPIIGVEVDDPKTPELKVVLLAKNRSGYSEISHIITQRHLNKDFNLMSILMTASEDIFILSPSLPLLNHLSKNRTLSLYGELVLTNHPGSKKRCRQLMCLAQQFKIPVVATNDVHLMNKNDYKVHRVLRAIQKNTTVYKVDEGSRVVPDNYFKSTEEMKTLFKDLGEALSNSQRIADECNLNLDLETFKFPECDLPEGKDADSFLYKLCFEGRKARYHPLRHEATKRLDYEMDVIKKLGLSKYFLIVNDIVKEARRRGFLYIGRGSAANSIVSYVLGLTVIDPLKYNLYFERFLNPERKSPPDIDLDFSWKERDEILNYVYDKYGHDKVAMICTTITFQPRMAVHEIAKTLGIPEHEINRFTSRIPHFFFEDLENLSDVPDCRDLPLDRQPWKGIIAIAKKIKGFPRHLSIHCGGIVIAPEPITHYTPLQRATKGFVITQMDMYPIEDLGLVKIDLLSQRSLGVLKDSLVAIEKNRGEKPDVFNFDEVTNDPETKELIRTGATIGCFYIESPGMRNLLQKLKTDTFEGLVAASSVIRPGVAESGMMQQYVERHRDPTKIEYLHPKMEELLKETYGVMVYQEDVIKVAHFIGGMSLGEADLLRRAMSGKMRSRESMEKLQGQFIANCLRQGISEGIIQEIWRQIKSFARYAFCKAHSASFAVLSYQVAYLKAHYPAEFMAAVLSNQGGFYGPGAYIEEAKRLGVKVLLPDINQSEKEYIGRNDTIRMGFMSIKNLSSKSIDSILKERNDGSFSSLSDLIRRTDVGFKELEILIKCGALNDFGATRPEMLWQSEIVFDRLNNKKKSSIVNTVYDDLLRQIPRLPEYNDSEKCGVESDVFGFSVTKHPMNFVRVKVSMIVSAKDMLKFKHKRVKMSGWLIAAKRITTRNDRTPMKFLSLEDLTGTYEVTIFPRIYQKYGHLTHGRGPYLIEGKVEEDHGACSLVAEKIELLDQ
ncbi:DNA polymerase III subunit alpha [candidate division KSB1 bacterium]|nr:DNA polymerase III subunit alpha [candidate division KSB1 bacterium]